LALADSFTDNGSPPDDLLLHPTIQWICPRVKLQGIADVRKYCMQLSSLKKQKRVNLFIDPDLIMINDEKVYTCSVSVLFLIWLVSNLIY
jgi:hypothetical protein